MNKQQRIVALLRAEYERASQLYRKAIAEHAAAIAGANAWDEFNPQDGVGGMSQNPYRVDFHSTTEMNSRTYLAQIKEAYDFAVDTFLGGDHS